MNQYVYIQAGNVNQCNPLDPDETLVSFRHVVVSAIDEDGAYDAGHKHQWTAAETFIGGDEVSLFVVLNDYVILIA
jgi:hypothetical protein